MDRRPKKKGQRPRLAAMVEISLRKNSVAALRMGLTALQLLLKPQVEPQLPNHKWNHNYTGGTTTSKPQVEPQLQQGRWRLRSSAATSRAHTQL